MYEGHHEVREGPRPPQPIPLGRSGLLSPLGPWRSPGRGHSASPQCFPGLCSLCPLAVDHPAPLPTPRPGEAAVAGCITTFTRELQPLCSNPNPQQRGCLDPGWGWTSTYIFPALLCTHPLKCCGMGDEGGAGPTGVNMLDTGQGAMSMTSYREKQVTHWCVQDWFWEN